MYISAFEIVIIVYLATSQTHSCTTLYHH